MEKQNEMHNQNSMNNGNNQNEGKVPAKQRTSNMKGKKEPKAAKKALEYYEKDITNIPLLTHEENVALSAIIQTQQGEEAKKAFNKLVEGNLRFVLAMAYQYENRGVAIEDLIAAGNVGLMKAAKKYDGAKGFKFTTYAHWFIEKEIKKAIGEKNDIRISSTKRELRSKIKKEVEALREKLHHEPSYAEIAACMKMKEKEVEALLLSNQQFISIEDVKDADTLQYGSQVGDNTGYEHNLLAMDMESVMHKILSDIEFDIVSKRTELFGNEKLSYDEIGASYHRTGEWARQQYHKAYEKISQCEELRELLQS